jgi:hypothetical protein
MLVIIILVFPSLMDNFYKQKESLLFQQSFILDNFYINNKIIDSSKILEKYSS